MKEIILKKSDFEFCPYIPLQSVQEIAKSKEMEKRIKETKYYQSGGDECLWDWIFFDLYCTIAMVIIIGLVLIFVPEGIWSTLVYLFFVFLFCNILAFLLFLMAKCIYCCYGL